MACEWLSYNSESMCPVELFSHVITRKRNTLIARLLVSNRFSGCAMSSNRMHTKLYDQNSHSRTKRNIITFFRLGPNSFNCFVLNDGARYPLAHFSTTPSRNAFPVQTASTYCLRDRLTGCDREFRIKKLYTFAGRPNCFRSRVNSFHAHSYTRYTYRRTWAHP